MRTRIPQPRNRYTHVAPLRSLLVDSLVLLLPDPHQLISREEAAS